MGFTFYITHLPFLTTKATQVWDLSYRDSRSLQILLSIHTSCRFLSLDWDEEPQTPGGQFSHFGVRTMLECKVVSLPQNQLWGSEAQLYLRGSDKAPKLGQYSFNHFTLFLVNVLSAPILLFYLIYL